MAITTYTELKTAVASWLNRSDLTDNIPDFINFAEKQLDRELPALGTDASTTVSTVAGTQTASLPSDYKGFRVIRLTYSGADYVLDYIPTAVGDRQHFKQSGRPAFFSITSASGTSKIKLFPSPDAVYTITVEYLASPTQMSASTANNLWIDKYPDLLLYATLMNAEPFIMNDERMAVWSGAYAKLIDQIKLSEEDKRFGTGGSLTYTIRGAT